MNSFATRAAAAAAAVDFINATKERCLYLYCAQELNNNAAVCFEEGLFDQATSSLHDGLKLLIAINNGNNEFNNRFPIGCCCSNIGSCSRDYCDHPCTLDGCIAFSEQTSFLFQCNQNSSRHSCDTTPTTKRSRIGMPFCKTTNAPKKRRLSCSRDVSTGFQNTDPLRGSSNSSDGYLYKRPIRVPLEGFCHCHKGYKSLLVVIVFNLAICHHINDKTNNSIDNNEIDEAKTKNMVFLYQLCLDLLRSMATCSVNNRASSMFEMIILNNLSQLYLVNDNPTKQKKSLEDLLSSLMVVIERKTRDVTGNASIVSSSNDQNNTNNSVNVNANANVSSSSHVNSRDNRRDSFRWASLHNGEQSKLVEGVLENLNPLILQEHCADAA